MIVGRFPGSFEGWEGMHLSIMETVPSLLDDGFELTNFVNSSCFQRCLLPC